MGNTALESDGEYDCWDDELLLLMAQAAWFVSAEDRNSLIHRSYCPTRYAPYGPRDPLGEGVNPLCEVSGCLDLVHDLLARMVGKIRGRRERGADHPIDNVRAYVAEVARKELVELHRAARTSLGFSAKPGRTDGVSGRIITRLTQEGDTGPWLTTLFRIMQNYPFSNRHVRGRWPLDGLCEERAQFFVAGNTPDRVQRDISLVMAIALECAGSSWVFDHLVLPLNASGPTEPLVEDRADAAPDADDALMRRWLRETYFRSRSSGMTREASYVYAARQVTGREAPHITREISQSLAQLDREWAAMLEREVRV